MLNKEIKIDEYSKILLTKNSKIALSNELFKDGLTTLKQKIILALNLKNNHIHKHVRIKNNGKQYKKSTKINTFMRKKTSQFVLFLVYVWNLILKSPLNYNVYRLRKHHLRMLKIIPLQNSYITKTIIDKENISKTAKQGKDILTAAEKTKTNLNTLINRR